MTLESVQYSWYQTKSITYVKSHTLDTSISAFLRTLSSLCIQKMYYCNAMQWTIIRRNLLKWIILRPLFFKNLSHLIFHLLNYLRPLGYWLLCNDSTSQLGTSFLSLSNWNHHSVKSYWGIIRSINFLLPSFLFFSNINIIRDVCFRIIM